MTFTYSITCTLDATAAFPPVAGSEEQRAYWVTPTLLAWPLSLLPRGMDREVVVTDAGDPVPNSGLALRLITAPDGGAAAVHGSILGADGMPAPASTPLRIIGNLPNEVLAAHPHLEGYIALSATDTSGTPLLDDDAVTSALTFEPLQAAGLTFTDVDRFAPELQNSEITMPAGAGDVPLANIKMIAALAVMKKAIEKADMDAFIKKHGTVGYAHTQGHIPAGVPFIGPACEGIRAGKMKRVMIIGKGSLFLARLTNLADGASFLIEAPTGGASAGAVSKEDVKSLILEALSEIAGKLN